MKSWLEINGDALSHNFRATRAAAGQDVETLAVIKADAYGHGATLCAPLLTRVGARWLGVTDLAEALEVRQALGETSTRILLMCGMEADDAPGLLAHHVTPVVWTPAHIAALDHAARHARQPFPVHIELDTGMARQGVAPGAPLDALLSALTQAPWVTCEGVLTHLCCSEVAGASTTALARQGFEAALAQFVHFGLRPPLLHVANTSAVDEGSTLDWLRRLAHPLGARAMVRTGLALFGYCLPLEAPGDATPAPNASPRLRPALQPVLTWKASILGLRDIPAGATVGYGATFVAPHPMRLALFQAGYADGFRRDASSGLGNGWVVLHGERAPVVGRVSMNLTVVDVTHIPNVQIGDPLLLLGAGVTAEDHARWACTIPYDILCGLRALRFLV